MSIKFKIHTPYGNTYYVNDKGEISANKEDFSEQWVFKSLQSVKSNYSIPFLKITPEKIKSLELRYKNGNPKFTVNDVDHGTGRTWGNTKVHGVKYIQFI